jgi:hypothetical protein
MFVTVTSTMLVIVVVVMFMIVVLMAMLAMFVFVLVVTLSMVLVHRIPPLPSDKSSPAVHPVVFIILLYALVLASNKPCGAFPGQHLRSLCFILKTVVVFANQFAEL